MAPTASLRHVSLEVSDIARTTWFYDRFLGELGFRRFVQEADYVAFTDGDLTLWLIKVRSPRIRRHPPTGEEEVVAEHLAFHVDSPERVAAIEAKLTKAELYPLFRGEEHPEFRPGYFSATWADPDQIVLEVYSVPAKKAKRGARRSAKPRRAATTKKKARRRT
ncbi:MAG TPA: VOC family protein [Thermoplasmata archaeon]|jgi:catechol 2,3-dioxygenase-like lactoylglutathione lyase family enzyme|nr:VOC family protein [Thermoplasmata archaeon]